MFLLIMKQQQKSTNRSEVNDNIYLNCNNIVFLKVLINKAKNAVSPKKNKNQIDTQLFRYFYNKSF